MSRIARSQPVSASMYRHFAVVTVIATVCLAMFADGESRETIRDETVRIAEKPNTAKATAAPPRRQAPTAGSFGPEERVAVDNSDAWFAPSSKAGNAGKKKKLPPGMLPPPGMEAVLAGGSTDAPSGLLVAVGEDAQEGITGPDEISEERMEAIMAASLARSGSDAE